MDGRDTERAVLAVQQALIDSVYNGGGVAPCSVHLLRGRAWQTADYYPGATPPPTDLSVVHTLVIDTAHPAPWGRRVAFRDYEARKPTGLYLSPGQVGTVAVPASIVRSGRFSVLVGAQTNDNSNKDLQLRMDRVTASLPISSTSTTIANPCVCRGARPHGTVPTA